MLAWFNTFRTEHSDKITHAALGYVGQDALASCPNIDGLFAFVTIVAIQIGWEALSSRSTYDSIEDTLATSGGGLLAWAL